MLWFGKKKAPISRHDALVALYGSVGVMNHQIHVSRAHRFIYFNNPKVACSSTKATLNTAVAARAGMAFDLPTMEAVHDRGANPLETPGQVGVAEFERMLADPGVLRFTFTRDPVSRFCSAYLSKLAPTKRGSGMARRLFARMGWAEDYPLTLEEFGALCAADKAIRDFDPHWRLQRDQIAFDLVEYGLVGDHAQYAGDFAAISRRIFGEAVPVFDTRERFGRFTEAGKVAQEVTPALRRDIESAYAADYEMLEEIRARGLRPD